jgi:AcrR family transcriptional regulator
VEAAIACIYEQGIHSTNFSDIAKRAHLHQPLINYYFPSFDSLLVECVQTSLIDLRSHQIASIEKNASSPQKALKAFILSPFEWVADNPKLQPLWLYFYHLTVVNKRFRDINNDIRNTGRERIALLLYKIFEKAGRNPPKGWTTEKLAWAIQATMTGYITMVVTEDSSIETAKQLLEAHVDATFELWTA